MAKIIFGGLVSDARNKEGGIVYSRNRGGAYSKGYVHQISPQTPFQLITQDFVRQANLRWKNTLTPGQRDIWNNYAAHSTQTNSHMPGGRRTGYQWYQSINIKSQTYYGSFIDAPPANLMNYEPGPASMSGFNVDKQELYCHFTHNPTGPDQVIVWATFPISAGRTRVYNTPTFFALIDAPTVSPVNVFDQFVLNLGYPTAGKTYGFKVNGINGVTMQQGYPWYNILSVGGTSEAMLTTTVSLTSAQLLSLRSVPITILPGPGAKKALIIHSVILEYVPGLTAYTVPASYVINFTVGSLAQNIASFTPTAAGTLDLTNTTAKIAENLATSPNHAAANTTQNAALVTAVTGGTGEMTLGTGTITVTVLYTIQSTTN